MAGRDKEVASLVRRAKAELRGGNRKEALSLLTKALAIDPESNAVTEAILQIERESQASTSKANSKTPSKPKKKATASKPAAREKPRPKPDRAQTKPRRQPPKKTASAEPKNERERTPSPPPKKESPQPRKRRARRLRAVPEALDRPEPSAQEEKPVEEAASATAPPTEREDSMASSDQLQTLLETAAEAMRSGDDSRAVSALKRARSIAPEHERVLELTESYKSSRKARKAIKLARQALAGRDPRKATAYARKAFQLDSEASGLDDLLEAIEGAKSAKSAGGPTAARAQSGGEADAFVQKIREKIQISSFPEAAKLTKEALEKHPGHELLETFEEKFKKMGLME